MNVLLLYGIPILCDHILNVKEISRRRLSRANQDCHYKPSAVKNAMNKGYLFQNVNTCTYKLDQVIF